MRHKTPFLIIGFGNQAKSWALNLRDSGHFVHIALRKQSPSMALAKKLDFEVVELNSEQLQKYPIWILLTPDHTHKTILENISVTPEAIIYAHGFSVVKNKFFEKMADCSHLLLAPKSIASELRFQFETKGKLGAVHSLEYSLREQDKEILFTLATGIGITAGPFETTFKQETDADLFSEQSLLCSVLPYAAQKCFEILREKGISKELAYFESWYEVKLIADAMIQIGPQNFFDLISPNALFGAEKGRKVIIDSKFENKLRQLWEDIESGKYYEELTNSDIPAIRKQVKQRWQNHELESLHRNLSQQLF